MLHSIIATFDNLLHSIIAALDSCCTRLFATLSNRCTRYLLQPMIAAIHQLQLYIRNRQSIFFVTLSPPILILYLLRLHRGSRSSICCQTIFVVRPSRWNSALSGLIRRRFSILVTAELYSDAIAFFNPVLNLTIGTFTRRFTQLVI